MYSSDVDTALCRYLVAPHVAPKYRHVLESFEYFGSPRIGVGGVVDVGPASPPDQWSATDQVTWRINQDLDAIQKLWKWVRLVPDRGYGLNLHVNAKSCRHQSLSKSLWDWFRKQAALLFAQPPTSVQQPSAQLRLTVIQTSANHQKISHSAHVTNSGGLGLL